MTRIRVIAIMVCVLYLLAGLAVFGAGQSSSVIKKPPQVDYNVSGRIGWQDYSYLAKNCGDLRIVISEQKGATISGGLRIPKYETLGYQYPTVIPNKSDCQYRVKLPEGKPVHLDVVWTGHFLKPVTSVVVRGSTQGWQNPITLKPGEKLVRDFKMTVAKIH